MHLDSPYKFTASPAPGYPENGISWTLEMTPRSLAQSPSPDEEEHDADDKGNEEVDAGRPRHGIEDENLLTPTPDELKFETRCSRWRSCRRRDDHGNTAPKMNLQTLASDGHDTDGEAAEAGARKTLELGAE